MLTAPEFARQIYHSPIHALCTIGNRLKRYRWKSGDVFRIELDSGRFCYSQACRHPEMSFFDHVDDGDLSLTHVDTLPVAFRIFVHKSVPKESDWQLLGNRAVRPELETTALRFKQDIISGRLSLYHESFTAPQFEKEATLAECAGLENVAVWELSHVMDRIAAHFSGEKCKWVMSLAINRSRVPADQR